MNPITMQKAVSRRPDVRNSLSSGQAMHQFMAQLFPLYRSITGEGTRQTLEQLRDIVPTLQIQEVASGSQALDWTVPQEWVVRDAYVQDESGNRVIDIRRSNLHLVSYSQPVRKRLRWSELKPHLHSMPDRPAWIPYKTSYFKDSWGFCLTYRQYKQLEAKGDREYEVVVDTDHVDGSLSYGEAIIPGASRKEILIWSHVCHPSLCNDNLSGVAVAAWLAQHVARAPRRHTYRFVFAPATIGAIAWLSRNRNNLRYVRYGLVLAGVGDAGRVTYKRSRSSTAEIDVAFEQVLQHTEAPFQMRDFEPTGYDERQFCSPGFNLPVGCLMRTPPGSYPEYHTSADDLSFVRPEALDDTLRKVVAVTEVLEWNRTYRNLKPFGEPQLGKHGVLQQLGDCPEQTYLAVQWVLNLSDGHHSLLDIARRSGLPFGRLAAAARLLTGCGLLDEQNTKRG